MYLDDYDETPWEALKYLVNVKKIFGYTNTIIVQNVRSFLRLVQTYKAYNVQALTKSCIIGTHHVGFV